jgi:glycosyltransferase involved in cell wall biosynthesis
MHKGDGRPGSGESLVSSPKITVGIPTFNRAGWLKESIESVLAQPFTSFRLVVSDNASTDDTPDVVHSFSDDRIDYMRFERNGGATANFNRLIAVAETEFLLLLPDDDVLYPGHLGAAVELLERFESVGLAHSAFELIDERSRVIRRVNPWVCRSAVTVERHDRALERLMASGGGLCFSSVVYRTKAIAATRGFREEEEPFGDLKLWMRIALDWDFAYIAEPLVGLRRHGETISANIAGRQGVTSSEQEDFLLYSRINLQRRMEFLDEAPLESRRTEGLRALAKLQLVVDTAALGIPWNETAVRLAKLLRTYPRILLRRKLWRLVVAQLGGRRVRSALRGAFIRQRPGQAWWIRSSPQA